MNPEITYTQLYIRFRFIRESLIIDWERKKKTGEKKK